MLLVYVSFITAVTMRDLASRYAKNVKWVITIGLKCFYLVVHSVGLWMININLLSCEFCVNLMLDLVNAGSLSVVLQIESTIK